jgi:hypothetical protein
MRRKEVKEDPNSVANGRFQCLVDLKKFHCLVALGRFHCLVALGRFHCLVALGRFHCLIALERFHCLVAFERFHCLVALERFHCLVANGKRRRITFSPLPTFPPTILLKLSIFPLILNFYFTMVLGPYLRISFHFLDL